MTDALTPFCECGNPRPDDQRAGCLACRELESRNATNTHDTHRRRGSKPWRPTSMPNYTPSPPEYPMPLLSTDERTRLRQSLDAAGRYRF